MPYWFVLPSLPPELCHEEIIKAIGSKVGEVRGIDASFYCCNNVKVLINIKLNQPKEFNKRFITSKMSYEIKFQIYKNRIINILKFDEFHKIMPKILPLTMDISNQFSWLKVVKNKMMEEQISPTAFQIQAFQKERTEEKKFEKELPKKRRLKSVIVAIPKEDTEMA